MVKTSKLILLTVSVLANIIGESGEKPSNDFKTNLASLIFILSVVLFTVQTIQLPEPIGCWPRAFEGIYKTMAVMVWPFQIHNQYWITTWRKLAMTQKWLACFIVNRSSALKPIAKIIGSSCLNIAAQLITSTFIFYSVVRATDILEEFKQRYDAVEDEDLSSSECDDDEDDSP